MSPGSGMLRKPSSCHSGFQWERAARDGNPQPTHPEREEQVMPEQTASFPASFHEALASKLGSLYDADGQSLREEKKSCDMSRTPEPRPTYPPHPSFSFQQQDEGPGHQGPGREGRRAAWEYILRSMSAALLSVRKTGPRVFYLLECLLVGHR